MKPGTNRPTDLLSHAVLRSREERELARRLSDVPAGEPPADLLDRLRADVPRDLGERLDRRAPAQDGQVEETESGSSSGPPRRWLAAAVLVTLVGGGWLALQLRSAAPSPQTWMEEQVAADREAAAPRTGDSREESPAGSLGETGDAGPPTATPERQPAGGGALEDDREWERLRRGPLDKTAETAAEESAAEQTAAPAGLEPPAASELRQRRSGTAMPAPPPAPARAPAADPKSVEAPAVQESADSAQVHQEVRLRVVVRDEERPGDTLPGVTVTVEGGGVRKVEVADVSGEAAFLVPPGRYTVTASLDGFNDAVGEVDLRGDAEEVAVAISLSAAFAEEIVVTGKLPIVETSSMTVAGSGRSRAGQPSRRQREMERKRAVPATPPPGEEVFEVVTEPVPLEESGVAADLVLDLPPAHRFTDAAADRLSTLGLDVDTGSWTLARAWLEDGRLPPPAAVRVEEVVNAQPYGDPFADRPARSEETFRLLADGAPTPFTPDPVPGVAGELPYRLLRFRVAARPLAAEERKPVVLTLVVDVSGSMEGERLELVRAGVLRLLEGLRPEDRVALVSFADEARVEAAAGDRAALRSAVDALAIRGGTNAEAGLLEGYRLARKAFRPGAANRVMLLSDGVANVGATTAQALLERVGEAARDGIGLSTIGVGMGDYNDALLEQLADRGDGRYAYVDGAEEAERLFAEELDGTFQTLAEEARVQVELDPRLVESWRLLGYENRAVADHEFRYESVDAGEVGPGDSVTALYEVKLRPEALRPAARHQPLALLKLRWREPAGADGSPGRFREETQRLTPADLAPSWDAAPADLRLAAVAAELAEVLRRSPHAASTATVADEARRLEAALAAQSPVESAPGRAAAELAHLTARARELLADVQ